MIKIAITFYEPFMYSKAIISLSSLNFFILPIASCFSHNICYFTCLQSYISSNSFFSLPPSTVPCAVKANTCRFNISIIVTSWMCFFCIHFHIAVSNFTGCFNQPFAQAILLTVLPWFKTADNFSAAFLHLPMALIPSVLSVLIWYGFLDSFLCVLWTLASDMHLLLLYLKPVWCINFHTNSCFPVLKLTHYKSYIPLSH